MIYKLTMERTLRIGVEFEADDDEAAVMIANDAYRKAMGTPQEFEGGDIEGDWALCNEEGKDLVVWS